MNFGYNKVRPYLAYYICVPAIFGCNLLRTAVVIDHVNHFNKSSLKAVTWFPDP